MQRAAWKHIRTRLIRAGMTMAVVTAWGAVSAQAQQPPAGLPGGQRTPGGPGGMRGGFGGPGMGAEFGKWMDAHKNVMAVRRKMSRIEQMNKVPDTQLTKAQAAKMLTVINAWKSKPNMSEDQAKSVDSQLTAMLNDKQRKQLDRRGQVALAAEADAAQAVGQVVWQKVALADPARLVAPARQKWLVVLVVLVAPAECAQEGSVVLAVREVWQKAALVADKVSRFQKP